MYRGKETGYIVNKVHVDFEVEKVRKTVKSDLIKRKYSKQKGLPYVIEHDDNIYFMCTCLHDKRELNSPYDRN